MLIAPEYKSITLQVHNQTTGVLEAIRVNTLAVDRRIPVTPVQLTVSGAAGSHYSNSYSFSIVIPGLKTATGEDRTMVRCIHGQLPAGIDMQIAREAAWSADAVTDVDAFLALPAADKQSRRFADHAAPFFIDHNTVAGQVGVFKMQATKTGAGVVPVYTANSDQGNSGLVIYQLDIPYTDGQISGRAAETALETALSGPTQVFLRRADSDPTNPDPWHMVGCLAAEVEKAYNYEYAQTMKGYNNIIVAKTIKQQLTDLNCNSTGDTTYLCSLVDAANIEEMGHAVKVKPRFGSKLEEFEVVLQSRSASGMIKWCRIPRATIQRNGSVTEGAAEFQIPFKVEGMEPAEYWFSHNLYQTEFVAAHINVGV